MENQAIIDSKISKLSKMYNYFEGKKAIKIISTMTPEEAEIVLSNSKVQDTILKIDDPDVLREIFRKSPAFFQEIMFSKEEIQDILISPRRKLKRREIVRNYNSRDFIFNEKEIRQLELFIRSIKSSKVFDQIIENQFFQRIIPMLQEKQISKEFFGKMEVVQLFNNIVNNDEIFKTKTSRQRNVIQVLNKVSNYILLPNNYQTIVDGKKFIQAKKWKSREYEKVYIDEKTLSMFTIPMLNELLEYDNIDFDSIVNFLRQDVINVVEKNNYNFNKIFEHLLQQRYEKFTGIDYIYFKVIVEQFDNNEKLKEKFLSFLTNALHINENIEELEQIMLKQVLNNKIKNNEITQEEYSELFGLPTQLKTVFYLKFNKITRRMDHLNGISTQQLIYLNVKHINQILNSMNMRNEDELSILYSTAIKLYMVFGLERTIRILNGEYGELNISFFDNISKLNVEKVELIKEGKKYIPQISNSFVNFMFAKQNDNHFKDMLSDPNSLLRKNWSYVYNNYDSIKEKCHGTVTLKKLNIILKELSPERELDEVTPNNYKLKENYILNDICLGNKTHRSNTEIYKNVLDIYNQMKKRIESSIPYIKGEASNGYYYEMMKLNDPIIFTLGYKGNCCIRVNDIAHNHLLHAALCRNGRILLIYNSNHEFAAFVPLKRNGEVLIANSIECLHKQKDEKAISAFEEAIKDIVSTSEEQEKEPIKLACIGSNSYARPDGKRFPRDIPTPTIFEKHDSEYAHTDEYHRNLIMVYKNPSLDLNEIKYGDPIVSYLDPRPQIKSCDFQNCDDNEKEEALKIINAIRYENADIEELENFVSCTKYYIDKCIYNDDWYLAICRDGNIYGDFLTFNPHAEKEYKIAFNEMFGISYENYIQSNTKITKIKFMSRY